MARERTWTSDAIVAALQAWAVRHGRPPTRREWIQALDSVEGARPSAMTVIRRFGSWNQAMVAAGFEPRPSGRPDGRRGVARS